MSDQIWMCEGQRQSQNVRGLWADIDDGGPQVFTREEMADIFAKNEMGVPLARDRFPEKVFHNRPLIFKQSLPQFFHSSYIFLNEKATKVLQEYDLGQGALHPVALFQHDRVTPIPANIKTLCIGNQKNTVLLDKSRKVERIWPRHDFFQPDLTIKDDDIIVDPACLAGPDLWADPKIKRVFFLSDRLGQALIKAGMKKAFSLIRCQVDRD